MNHQRFLIYFLVLIVYSFISCNNESAIQRNFLNVLNINDSDDLKRFFRYTGNDGPIISGHRGGIVPGFPENSIAAFENTLRFTPAFFEVDPRLTKDSIVVLMHDVNLDRTTTGSGKVGDYTWNELKKLKLKDLEGNVTEYHIPTLEEAIEWSRGKTILNLDKKDVPMVMTATKIKEQKAEAFVIVTVHNAQEAKFYFSENQNIMFSAFIKTMEDLEKYDREGIPSSNIAVAYVGPEVKYENEKLYRILHERGIKYMISTASTYDKKEEKEVRRNAYLKFIKEGVDVIESDFPIEVAHAISSTKKNENVE